MRVPVASVQNIPVQTAPVQQSSLQTMQQPMPQSVPQPPNPQDIQQNQGNNYIYVVMVFSICFSCCGRYISAFSGTKAPAVNPTTTFTVSYEHLIETK